MTYLINPRDVDAEEDPLCTRKRPTLAIAGNMLEQLIAANPMRDTSFFERSGTSLINGGWFVRQLKRFSDRVVLMHGHRHIDWIESCGALKLMSAPSPVMEALNHQSTSFMIRSIARAADASVELREPFRVNYRGEKSDSE